MSSAYSALPVNSPHVNGDGSELSSRHVSHHSTDSEKHNGGATSGYAYQFDDLSRRQTAPSYLSSVSVAKRPLRWSLACIAFLVFFAIVALSTGSTSLTSRLRHRKLLDLSGLQLPLRYDLRFPEKTHAPSQKLGFTPFHNRTLGFGKIYVLNVPSRRDKKAELSVLAYQYDLDLTFIDAVNVSGERPDLADDRGKLGIHGVAEGHSKVWRTMLEDGVETALIMEDDVDFNIAIKDQLLRIQEPLSMLTSLIDGHPSYSDPNDPYNYRHWDQLWLGEETEKSWYQFKVLQPNITLPFVVYRDPTRGVLLVDDEHEQPYLYILGDYNLPFHQKPSEADQRLRVIQQSYEPFALSGYALTRRGAKMSLYKNAHKSWVDHIDFDLKEMSREAIGRHYTVVPPLFQQRKPLEGEDSDRSGDRATHVIAGKLGRTSTIQNTARENLFDDLLKEKKPFLVQRA